MSLPDVLLSLLREPQSGTELIRLFRSTMNHFWKTDLSQIYRSLEVLESQGCLLSASVPSTRGPASRVYKLTVKGQARLADWIRQPAQLPAMKLEFLAQIFSVTADEQPAVRARELLLSMRGDAARSVEALEEIDALMGTGTSDPEAMPDFVFYPWLTLQHGILRRRALLEWIDTSLAQLDRRQGSRLGPRPTNAISDLLQVIEKATGKGGPGGPVNEQ